MLLAQGYGAAETPALLAFVLLVKLTLSMLLPWFWFNQLSSKSLKDLIVFFIWSKECEQLHQEFSSSRTQESLQDVTGGLM